jgi:hypothetical protein
VPAGTDLSSGEVAAHTRQFLNSLTLHVKEPHGH